MRRLRRVVLGEGGHSLIELVVVMGILGTVLGGLTTLFVQGSNAELDLNLRFQAQQNAALALRKLRAEVHCTSSVTPAGASSTITLTLPAQCPIGGGGTASWCTVGSGSRYALYRKAGATCDASGELVADYLTTGTVFTYTGQVTGTSLAKLRVDLPVNVRPSRPVLQYRLVDEIVLRNSTRT